MFNIELARKMIIGYIIIAVLIICYGTISLLIYVDTTLTNNKINAFNNNEVLVCGTLIVSNYNWNLVNNHLINTNSAGYINIKNCVVQE